jgi:hypothetical protein
MINTVARLGRRVAPKGPDLTVNPTGIFRNDLAEGISLDGDLLSSFDLLIQFDQKFDESALGREDRKSAIADKDARIFRGPAHRTGDHSVMLEHVHRAFNEQGNLLEVQDARVADLGRERWNAHFDKRIRKKSRIAGIIEDLIDGVEFCHRPDLGDVHFGKMKCGDVHSGRPGMKI